MINSQISLIFKSPFNYKAGQAIEELLQVKLPSKLVCLGNYLKILYPKQRLLSIRFIL